MNLWVVGRTMGSLLLGFGFLPIIVMAFALFEGDAMGARAMATTLGVSLASGAFLFVLGGRGARGAGLDRKEAVFLVPATWVVTGIVGAIPFVLSTHLSWLDALFETVSGFTTTGASIYQNVEVLPKSILLWRALIQWIGGVGIVALFVAVLPGLGVGAKHMFFAEAPGPEHEGFLPRVRSVAIRICMVYVALSAAFTLALWACGMPLFDAVCHMMAGLATGGYSTWNASIGHFAGPLIPWVTILLMAAGGTNLSLFHRMARGRKLVLSSDPEAAAYVVILLAGGGLLAVDTLLRGHSAGVYSAAKDGLFAAVSIQTTTGFATVDFNTWSTFSKFVLLTLMFVGGSSGSTGGGFKVVRLLLILKIAVHQVGRTFHPKKVAVLKMGNHVVDSDIRDAVLGMLICYLIAMVLSCLAVSACGLDFEASIGGTLATLSNVGPGLSVLGPVGNYAAVPAPAKVVFIIDMLLGRLEFLPVLMLFYPSLWRK